MIGNGLRDALLVGPEDLRRQVSEGRGYLADAGIDEAVLAVAGAGEVAYIIISRLWTAALPGRNELRGGLAGEADGLAPGFQDFRQSVQRKTPLRMSPMRVRLARGWAALA